MLEDPDFATSLRDAVLIAARTEAEDKRGLLADLVAQRATAESEGLEALVVERLGGA